MAPAIVTLVLKYGIRGVYPWGSGVLGWFHDLWRSILVRILICRTNILKELFDDFPEDQRRSLVFECDAPSIRFIADRVLEMRPTEIGMVLVLVPASVKAVFGSV